jgi:hypothetical protein
MPEEKTQHLPRGVRSLRISVGARGAASRPRVAGAVDILVLQDFAPARVGMSRACICSPLGFSTCCRYSPIHRPEVSSILPLRSE